MECKGCVARDLVIAELEKEIRLIRVRDHKYMIELEGILKKHGI